MSAEVLAGVTTATPVQTSNSGGGPSTSSATSTNTTGIISTQTTSEAENINLNNTSAGNSQNNSSNTISAAADSSDNQPSTPQPHLANSNESTQIAAPNLNPYSNQIIYGNSQQSGATSNTGPHLNQMYSQNIYAQNNIDLQQQHQQLQQHPSSAQNQPYPSFLNSYEQFYQQQQQQTPTEPNSQNQNPQQMDFINSNTNPSLFSSTVSSGDYKHQTIVRYHPYLQTPTSGIAATNSQNSNSNNAIDASSPAAPVVSAASSTVMSPRVASSTSPSSSSNQMQISGSASSIGSMSVGNPSSPNSAGSPQCKKCGIMCTNDSELQEHITNVHGASPYGSSGYSSSPYIKDEMQQQTPPSQNLQQQPPTTQQTVAQGVNPGDILDLDSQKLLYPEGGGSMPAMMHTNLGNSTDPLHGLHNMQQRAWDQQSQEGVPPYLQQQLPNSESKNHPNHSPFYQAPKQSPYPITNSSNIIKTEYQSIIKSEYSGDALQYTDDKSFDPTATNQQQQMMPPAVPSSPAEFPTTTTGGPQDNQQQNVGNNQQFRGGNFEPPSSSSASIPSGPIGTKAANWKSNEARRPKTYNCTACNKWFTSSGHLKRHYNTTLHKNAVKSSGQPDPATLPISAHHHPARDPNGKTGRGRGSNAAANAANNNAQQQQQPPNPVQPPEPPNSPQGYGTSQVAAAGLTSLSHYTNTASPNGIYEHHQYQYVPQVQSTTNAVPQHATSMSNHHLLPNQQQQTVLNGHPNELAGLSVQTTVYQQQTPMPSSQMRGLLNTTLPLLTATKTLHIAKTEHLEAATMEDPHHEKEAEEFGYLPKVEVKREYLEEMEERDQGQVERIVYSRKTVELVSEKGTIQQQMQSVQALTREVDHNVQHHHNGLSEPMQHYQLDPDMDHFYHNIMPNNTPVHLPPITSHQLYPAQQQQLHQTVDPDTYTIIQTPLLLQQQHNITDHQQYINILSDTSMPPNNMQLLQPQFTITELEPDTTIPTTNMVSIQPLSHHHTQQPPLQHMELQQQVNMSQQLDTTNTNTPSHTTTTHNNNIISIRSYHQQQLLDSVPPQLEHTLTSPPTIIGNAEIVTVQANGNLIASSDQQFVQTSGGRLYQILPSAGRAATAQIGPTQCYSKHLSASQKSPTAGDLPPQILRYQQETNAILSMQENTDPSEVKYKSLTGVFLKKHLGPRMTFEEHTAEHNEQAKNSAEESPTSIKASSSNKRTRNYSTSNSLGTNSTVLPSGRIKCLPCDKEFTKMCYLTQHNNSFHSGEYPFRCQKCGKRYQVEDVYINHLNKHKTTDKAHKCELCPKQFHHKTDLRRHIEAIHTGNKQHSCEVCEKSFCRKDHLRKHLETHNRARVLAKKNQERGDLTAIARSKKSKLSIGPNVKLNQPNQIDSFTIGSIPNLTDLIESKPSASAATTNYTTSPLLQHYEDVTVENLELLENNPNLEKHFTTPYKLKNGRCVIEMNLKNRQLLNKKLKNKTQ